MPLRLHAILAAVLAIAPAALADTGPGSFVVRDVTAGAEVPTAGADAPVRLTVTATPAADYLLLRGSLENLRHDDRAFIVDYRIPKRGAEARFSGALDEDLPLPARGEREGNVYPLAAMSDARGGVAVAIPPDAPAVFGLVASPQGLAIRFYLGTSPAARRSLNRADFALIVYSTDARWGFRGALERYYRFFPDFYTARLKPGGLWMFQMGDRMPPNVTQYGFDEIEPQGAPGVLDRAIARDRKFGIPMFPYTIVGEREIKNLPALPKNYDAAMQAFAQWRPPGAGAPASKEDVSADSVRHLREEILSAACETADHRYALVIRNTTWGGNSVTFKIDPNPELAVGRDTLAAVDQWIGAHPEFAGVYVDSLGANWPATLDYRRDHFAVARRPLTFDAQGRIALQNDLSHYEFLSALRAKLRPSGRMVFGNGIYGYKSRGTPRGKVGEVQTFDNQLNEFAAGGAPPEHYRAGARLGRFFDAALLDVGGSEAGINANVERCQDARVFMGPKPYAFLNYRWEQASQVAEYFNKSLCYGIFATCSRNFLTGVQYENNPKGYGRDRALIDWFVPLARKLSAAGWQPVTDAHCGPPSIHCERFGQGAVVYFTLYNDSAKRQHVTWAPDLAALGTTAAAGRVKEIAHGALGAQPAAAGALALDLDPKTTYILELSSDGGR